MYLNGKVRNRNLTASEIHFARDNYDHSNLLLDDKSLQTDQKLRRNKNHPYVAKSKAPKGKPMTIPDVEKGDVVFVKRGESKHESREPHIVIGKDVSNKAILKKALHMFPRDHVTPKLSHKTKTVDQKFLFKLPDKRLPDTSSDSDSDFTIHESSSTH